MIARVSCLSVIRGGCLEHPPQPFLGGLRCRRFPLFRQSFHKLLCNVSPTESERNATFPQIHSTHHHHKGKSLKIKSKPLAMMSPVEMLEKSTNQRKQYPYRNYLVENAVGQRGKPGRLAESRFSPTRSLLRTRRGRSRNISVWSILLRAALNAGSFILRSSAMNKKLRFEVFKRDRFKCSYCGRTLPGGTS